MNKGVILTRLVNVDFKCALETEGKLQSKSHVLKNYLW